MLLELERCEQRAQACAMVARGAARAFESSARGGRATPCPSARPRQLLPFALESLQARSAGGRATRRARHSVPRTARRFPRLAGSRHCTLRTATSRRVRRAARRSAGRRASRGDPRRWSSRVVYGRDARALIVAALLERKPVHRSRYVKAHGKKEQRLPSHPWPSNRCSETRSGEPSS